MAAPWTGAGSLDRWIARRWWRSSSPPCRAPSPAASPSRQTMRKGKVGCVSVPRELVEAERTEVAVAAEAEEEGVACDGCGGAGWLLCDFCKGKKNNIKSESTSRIYRRCPTCKAAGFVLCPRCRVFKCITFPESNDS